VPVPLPHAALAADHAADQLLFQDERQLRDDAFDQDFDQLPSGFVTLTSALASADALELLELDSALYAPARAAAAPPPAAPAA
jgi:hypothetical protein